MTGFRVLAAFAATAMAMGALAGCSGARETLGIGPLRPPDEFAVLTQAPLVLPPDYSLRPPVPGAPRPAATEAASSAQSALLNSGSAAGTATGSAPAAQGLTVGETALLGAAGATVADPGIRALVDFEVRQIAQRTRPFVERLLDLRDPFAFDAALDPVAEAERLSAAGLVDLPPNVGRPEARQLGGGLFGL